MTKKVEQLLRQAESLKTPQDGETLRTLRFADGGLVSICGAALPADDAQLQRRTDALSAQAAALLSQLPADGKSPPQNSNKL